MYFEELQGLTCIGASCYPEPVSTRGLFERPGARAPPVGRHKGHNPYWKSPLAGSRALESNPEFPICDEPTPALDVSVRAQILDPLKDLQDKLGLACLPIARGLPAVHQAARRTGVMHLGRLCEAADIPKLPE